MTVSTSPETLQASLLFYWISEVEPRLSVKGAADDEHGLVESFMSQFPIGANGDREYAQRYISSLLNILHRDGYLIRVVETVEHRQPREPVWRYVFTLPPDIAREMAADRLTPDELSRRWGG